MKKRYFLCFLHFIYWPKNRGELFSTKCCRHGIAYGWYRTTSRVNEAAQSDSIAEDGNLAKCIAVVCCGSSFLSPIRFEDRTHVGGFILDGTRHPYSLLPACTQCGRLNGALQAIIRCEALRVVWLAKAMRCMLCWLLGWSVSEWFSGDLDLQ